MNSTSTASILRAAKDVILTRGWTRGEFENTRGEVCLEGALGIVFQDPTCAYKTIKQPWQVIERVVVSEYQYQAIHGNAVTDWNDDPARTPEDILALLDRAIALAEAEEAQPAPQDQTVRT